MSHQICLKLPLLCMMVFSVIVGREQEDSRLYHCGDMECREAISIAEGLNDFPALTPDKLSFRRHAQIEILAKPADGSDHWIGRVANKVGLVPAKLIQEQRILVKTPQYKQKFDRTAFAKLSDLREQAKLPSDPAEKVLATDPASVISHPVEAITKVSEPSTPVHVIPKVLEPANVQPDHVEIPKLSEPTKVPFGHVEKIQEPNLSEPQVSPIHVEEIPKPEASEPPQVSPIHVEEIPKPEASEPPQVSPIHVEEIPKPEASEPPQVPSNIVEEFVESEVPETANVSAYSEELLEMSEPAKLPSDHVEQIHDVSLPENVSVHQVEAVPEVTEESLLLLPFDHVEEILDVSLPENVSLHQVEAVPEVTESLLPSDHVEEIQVVEPGTVPFHEVEEVPEEAEMANFSSGPVEKILHESGPDGSPSNHVEEIPEVSIRATVPFYQVEEKLEVSETAELPANVEEVLELSDAADVAPDQVWQIPEPSEPINIPSDLSEGREDEAPNTSWSGAFAASEPEHGEDPTILDEEVHTHVHPPKVNPLLDHGTPAHSHRQECERTHDDHHHHHHHRHHHDHDHHEEASEYSFGNSVLVAMRHLSSTLVGFLPEYLQDTILDVKDSLVFTGIIALTLVSICVPYFFIELFFSVRPLKKKVTDLNKTLWKVSTAFENQQDEYDMYKEKALAYDEDKKQLEQLETELYLVKQIEVKLKTENRTLKKRINKDVKVAEELEALITKTINERDQVKEERDKLKGAVSTLQVKLKETTDQLITTRTDDHSKEMDLKLLTHTNENLELRGTVLEKEIGELKSKLNTEIDLRRELQSGNDSLSMEKHSIEEELVELKSMLHKYEELVNNLNDEISGKENELTALREVLGEDSPLVDIAEVTGKLKVAEGQVSSLQARVESITLENSSLTRDYEKAKKTLNTLQTEKDQAETRLQVLEAYFKEKEDELKRMVEKYEAEKEIRGKDKDELVQMIEEKNDALRDMTERLEKLKQEFEDTKLAHRNEIRALEAKGHETWLSLCQSERKAQEVRKESELLRQKLTTIAKTKEADGHDALSSNGDVPYSFSQLDLEDIPPPLPDEPTLPSYFGLGDFEPPVPLDDDDEDDEDDEVLGVQQNLRRHVGGGNHEPQRPPPLGQMSPNYSDQDEDEREFSPIRGLGGRTEYSDGSSSPPSPPQGLTGDRAESRENYMNGGSLHPRRRQPVNASSPFEHGVNL